MGYRSGFHVVSQLAERLEDGTGHISGLRECLTIINETRDEQVRLREVGKANAHLRAIFQIYSRHYQEIQALKAGLRQMNISIEV